MYSVLARWCYRNPWRVIGAWFLILLGIFGTVGALGPSFSNSFTIPDSESNDGFDLLEEHFAGAGAGAGGTIVFEAEQGVDDPEVQSAASALLDSFAAETGSGGELEGMFIRSPFSPQGAGQISSQGPRAGEIAYAQLSLPPDVDQVRSGEMGAYIAEQIEVQGLNEIEGLRVEVGGAILVEFEPPESELLGLAFAVFVLIVAMGSVLAMGTTIGVAVLGVAGGFGLMAIVSNFTTVPEFATTIGLMIGLGVGIDYALFIVNRYREALRDGFEPEGATMVALDTAGRSVVFAGATVVVSLLGLLLIGLDFISGLGYAAAATVLIVMLTSITLLPAALGLVRERVNVTRWRGMIAASLVAVALLGLGLSIQPFLFALPLAIIVAVAGYLPFAGPLKKELPARKEVALRDSIWFKFSHTIQARPWFWMTASATLLIVLAIPVLSLNLGFSDEGNYGEETTTRQAYDLIAEGFGPGANGPLIVVSEVSSAADLELLNGLSQSLNADAGVAFASPPQPNDPENPTAVLIQLQPSTSPQDEATEDLVFHLREEVIPAAVADSAIEPKLTGATAANIDFTEFLSGRIVLFFAVVLALSFVLLMVVFRSLLVPLKAVIMNMLSIGAAYGISVAIFQWGWFGSVLGIEPAPIEPFLPMMMFAIVFGLSMDYEVFILSRIKEEFERTGDPVNSVADGLAATARVITAAAAIMVVVFGSFVFEDDRIIKLFGLGLASAVLIDASIVRMFLVPSTMQLLGAKNWWLPSWLDKILPNLNVEGGHHEPPAASIAGLVDPEAPTREPEFV
jgi:RND superfamily putative drug exporter